MITKNVAKPVTIELKVTQRALKHFRIMQMGECLELWEGKVRIKGNIDFDSALDYLRKYSVPGDTYSISIYVGVFTS